MSAPRKTLKKETDIRSVAAKVPKASGTRTAASKAPTATGQVKTAGTVKASGKTGMLAGGVGSRAAKPIGKVIGGKGRGPVYETPKPVRPRTVKK